MSGFTETECAALLDKLNTKEIFREFDYHAYDASFMLGAFLAIAKRGVLHNPPFMSAYYSKYLLLLRDSPWLVEAHFSLIYRMHVVAGTNPPVYHIEKEDIVELYLKRSPTLLAEGPCCLFYSKREKSIIQEGDSLPTHFNIWVSLWRRDVETSKDIVLSIKTLEKVVERLPLDVKVRLWELMKERLLTLKVYPLRKTTPFTTQPYSAYLQIEARLKDTPHVVFNVTAVIEAHISERKGFIIAKPYLGSMRAYPYIFYAKPLVRKAADMRATQLFAQEPDFSIFVEEGEVEETYERLLLALSQYFSERLIFLNTLWKESGLSENGFTVVNAPTAFIWGCAQIASAATYLSKEAEICRKTSTTSRFPWVKIDFNFFHYTAFYPTFTELKVALKSEANENYEKVLAEMVVSIHDIKLRDKAKEKLKEFARMALRKGGVLNE